jgi:dipeptidyl aminopeptidase/acylaminoacyl peptidase
VIVNARARFLLIHGTDDVVVPVSNVRRLAAAGGAAVQTWILPGRGHSDPHRESEMAAKLSAFFRRPS